jgi:hypothetical protein
MFNTAQHLIETLTKAHPLLMAISEEEASQKPSPEKWSKKEIIGHLIDSACNNHQKFVRTLCAKEGHLDFTGYVQDEWVAVQNYQASDWSQLVLFWEQYNLRLAQLMVSADPVKLSNTITIEGTGPFRLDFIMPDYVEHLKHHLKAVLPNAGIESTFSNVYNA